MEFIKEKDENEWWGSKLKKVEEGWRACDGDGVPHHHSKWIGSSCDLLIVSDQSDDSQSGLTLLVPIHCPHLLAPPHNPYPHTRFLPLSLSYKYAASPKS